jgi:hypothetical protein
MGSFPRMRLTAFIASALATGVLAGCGEKSEPDVVAPVDPATTDAAANGTGGAGSQGGDQGGGGGGGGQATPEEQVEDAVVAVIGGGDPADACSALVTDRYVRTAYGDSQGCRAAVSKQGSFDVLVSAVDIQGSRASAKAKPAAGPNKGETINVKLVEEQGTWKVDSALSNAPAGP